MHLCRNSNKLRDLCLSNRKRANENQTCLQEQMAKKDEDHARELAQFQGQLLEALQRRPETVPALALGIQIVIAQRDNDPSALLEKILKMGAKEFFGNEDALESDNWLDNTENIFEVFRSTGHQRVTLAAYMFRHLADTWWKIVKPPYQTIADGEALATFNKQFAKKHVPGHIKKKKAVGFMQLKQGNMSVLDYVNKFDRLSTCAPHIIDTKQKKIDRFLQGLHPVIKKDATGITPPSTYDDTVKRAYKF